MTSRISGKIPIEKALAFTFGCIFVITLIVLSLVFPEPTVTQWFVFKIVLALGAGAIGAVLPGVLEVRVGNWVRGAGALGLVALVAFLPVEALVVKIPTPPSIEDARAVVDPLLNAVDRQDYQAAYDELGPLSQGRISNKLWLELGATSMQPLGKGMGRKLAGFNSARVLFQEPRGDYITLTYRANFEKSPTPIMESVTLYSNDGKKWQIFSYQISPHNIGNSK
jgi:Protein of unknown function (DUF4019)